MAQTVLALFRRRLALLGAIKGTPKGHSRPAAAASSGPADAAEHRRSGRFPARRGAAGTRRADHRGRDAALIDPPFRSEKRREVPSAVADGGRDQVAGCPFFSPFAKAHPWPSPFGPPSRTLRRPDSLPANRSLDKQREGPGSPSGETEFRRWSRVFRIPLALGGYPVPGFVRRDCRRAKRKRPAPRGAGRPFKLAWGLDQNATWVQIPISSDLPVEPAG